MTLGWTKGTSGQATFRSRIRNYERIEMIHDIVLRLVVLQTFIGELGGLARRDKAKAAEELMLKEKNINDTINEIYTLLSQLPIDEVPLISICPT
jgi:hypothetical protein